jgi:hypothetical protein
MQTDGVGMWTTLRPLFDPNPALVPYRDIPSPPPLVPELLALPSVARRLVWRGRLRQAASNGSPLVRGLAIWETRRLREKRHEVRGSFNLLTSATVIHEVFTRHPDRDRLNVGLTAYFPFLEGRNKYGVFLCKVTRRDVAGNRRSARQARRSNPMLNWGQFGGAGVRARDACPTRPSLKRRWLVLSPADRRARLEPARWAESPSRFAGIPAVISCHPVGADAAVLLPPRRDARQQLHVSFTSRFPQDESFLDLESALAA